MRSLVSYSDTGLSQNYSAKYNLKLLQSNYMLKRYGTLMFIGPCIIFIVE